MKRRGALVGATTTLAVALALGCASSSAAANRLGSTERVSVGAAGAEPDGQSYWPSVSADGRYVTFASEADNLVPDDTNGVRDVFVRDRLTGTTERASVATDGSEGGAPSGYPQISADGRTVAFVSAPTTFAGAQPATGGNLFLRDLDAGTTRSVARADGSPVPVSRPALSGNGRYVAFMTGTDLVRRDRNGSLDVYRIDVTTGQLRLVSVSRFGGSEWQLNEWPSISRSGRYVAFQSAARLVKRDHNRTRDIYVRDLNERHPRLVSMSSRGDLADKGSMGASISATGRYVVFSSLASTLVRRDTNKEWDVFIHDRRRGTTRRVSVPDGGGPSNGQSQAYAVWAERAGVTRDGRYVVFSSVASNLVADDDNEALDVFLRDLALGRTRLVSATPDGTPGNGDSSAGALSADSSTLVLGSDATDLVAGDSNSTTDVFARAITAQGRN
jgi:Tol biopolymer transport system component